MYFSLHILLKENWLSHCRFFFFWLQEQPDNEKPDDDEDKKNPAYVPRRGAFYEHDFRQGDEGPEGEEEEPAKEPAK